MNDTHTLDCRNKRSPLAFLALRKFISSTQDRPDKIKVLLSVDYKENLKDITKVLEALGNPYRITETEEDFLDPEYSVILERAKPGLKNEKS